MNGIWIKSQDWNHIKFVTDIRIEEGVTYKVICDGRYFGSFNTKTEVDMFMSILSSFIRNGCDEYGDTIFYIPTQ